jgi:hypothetical protein
MAALFGFIRLLFREADRAVGLSKVQAADMSALSAADAFIERLFTDEASLDFIFHG